MPPGPPPRPSTRSAAEEGMSFDRLLLSLLRAAETRRRGDDQPRSHDDAEDHEESRSTEPPKAARGECWRQETNAIRTRAALVSCLQRSPRGGLLRRPPSNGSPFGFVAPLLRVDVFVFFVTSVANSSSCPSWLIRLSVPGRPQAAHKCPWRNVPRVIPLAVFTMAPIHGFGPQFSAGASGAVCRIVFQGSWE